MIQTCVDKEMSEVSITNYESWLTKRSERLTATSNEFLNQLRVLELYLGNRNRLLKKAIQQGRIWGSPRFTTLNKCAAVWLFGLS